MSFVAEEFPYPGTIDGEVGVGLVEDLGQRTPPGPAGEDSLVRVGWVPVAERLENFEGGDVGVELGSLA